MWGLTHNQGLAFLTFGLTTVMRKERHIEESTMGPASLEPETFTTGVQCLNPEQGQKIFPVFHQWLDILKSRKFYEA
jgi:hypothetical protein